MKVKKNIFTRIWKSQNVKILGIYDSEGELKSFSRINQLW